MNDIDDKIPNVNMNEIEKMFKTTFESVSTSNNLSYVIKHK